MRLLESDDIALSHGNDRYRHVCLRYLLHYFLEALAC